MSHQTPEPDTSYGRRPHGCPYCSVRVPHSTNEHQSIRTHARVVHGIITAKNCSARCPTLLANHARGRVLPRN